MDIRDDITCACSAWASGPADTLASQHPRCPRCGLVLRCGACGGCRRCRPDNPLRGQTFPSERGGLIGQPPDLARPPRNRVEVARLVAYLADPHALAAWLEMLERRERPI